MELLREKIHTFVIPSDSRSQWLGGGGTFSLRLYLCLSYLSWWCLFTSVVEDVLLAFRFLSKGIISYVVVAMLCPWEEVSSGFSYTIIFNLIFKNTMFSALRYVEYLKILTTFPPLPPRRLHGYQWWFMCFSEYQIVCHLSKIRNFQLGSEQNHAHQS